MTLLQKIKFSDKNLVLAGLVLSAIIFAIDLSTELGFTGGVPYVLVVLLGLWTSNKDYAIRAGILSTILTLLGLTFSPYGGKFAIVLANRIVALIVIWATTALCVLHHRQTGKLADRERQFSSIFENAVDGMALINDRGIVQMFNAAAEKIFGYRKDEVIGNNISLLMPEPDKSRHDGYVRRYLETGEAKIIGIGREVEGRRKSGQIFPMDLSVNEIRLGKERMFVGAIRDLTLRKQAEEAITRFGRLLDQSTNEIYIFDAETLKFIQVNEGACRNMGYSMKELLQLTPYDIKPDHNEESFRELVRPLIDGEREQIFLITKHRRKDGSTYPVESRLQLSKTEGRLVFVAVLNDISLRRQAEEQYTLVSKAIEQSPASAFITDASGMIEYVNPSFSRTTGYKALEVIGKNPRILNSGEHKPEFFKKFWDTILSGKEWRGTIRNKKKNGDLYWERLSVTPIRGSEGEITHFVAVQVDDTERRKAEEALRKSEQRFTDIMNFTPGVIYIKDLEGKYLMVNSVYEKLFDVTNEEVQGKTDMEIFPGEIGEAFMENDRKVIQGGKAIEFEEVAPHDDRPHTYISLKFPLRDDSGDVYALCGISTDITERKESEKMLKRYAEELAQSNRSLDDFASIASHDLQEPLRKVMVFGDRLKDNFSDALGERGQDYLTRMINASSRMQIFIDDLLKYSRISSKAQPFRKVNLKQVVEDVLLDLEISIAESGGKVEVGELPELDADPMQMRQLFQNLISNAIKFQNEGKVPSVTVQSHMNGDDSWEITVKDNGIGFDESQLERILKPFERLHGKDEYKGSGMGLAICRKIVERHKGNITAQSRPNEGAAFLITLPKHQASD